MRPVRKSVEYERSQNRENYTNRTLLSSSLQQEIEMIQLSNLEDDLNEVH